MTIQQQRRPTTSTRASEKSTLKKSVLACFIVLSALAVTATAEIAFISPPANSTFRPNDVVLLTWSLRPVSTNISVPTNTAPFDLSLRAKTGQRYTLQTGVVQSLLSLQIQIPADVTGGLVSLRRSLSLGPFLLSIYSFLCFRYCWMDGGCGKM